MLSLLLAASLSTTPAADPTPVPLWTGEAPATLGTPEGNRPTLTAYLPADKPTGTAVVICPGGGYGNLAIDTRGNKSPSG